MRSSNLSFHVVLSSGMELKFDNGHLSMRCRNGEYCECQDPKKLSDVETVLIISAVLAGDDKELENWSGRFCFSPMLEEK